MRYTNLKWIRDSLDGEIHCFTVIVDGAKSPTTVPKSTSNTLYNEIMELAKEGKLTIEDPD
jgi:hypothetical protein